MTSSKETEKRFANAKNITHLAKVVKKVGPGEPPKDTSPIPTPETTKTTNDKFLAETTQKILGTRTAFEEQLKSALTLNDLENIKKEIDTEHVAFEGWLDTQKDLSAEERKILSTEFSRMHVGLRQQIFIKREEIKTSSAPPPATTPTPPIVPPPPTTPPAPTGPTTTPGATISTTPATTIENLEIINAKKENNRARNDLFTTRTVLKEGKTDREKNTLKDLEEKYKATKKAVIETLLNSGPEGKIKAREFLLHEVELQRKNNLENKLVGKGERFVAGVSKGIEKWDNWGKGEGWKNYLQRLAKTGISLTMIGAISGLSVEGLAKMGIGTASAVGGGITSYLGRRFAFGAGMATIMAKIPDNKKKWISRTLMAGSAGMALAGGGLIAGGALVTSSAIGYGLSSLTKRYHKKIESRAEEAKKGQINLATLEADVEKIEKEMGEALQKAEKTRILGKLLEGTTAVAGSMAALELFGAVAEHNQNKVETQAEKEAHAAEIKFAKTPHQGKDIELKPDAASTLNIITTQVSANPEDAVVHQGEGIEHALRRQIEHNSDLAKALGFDGNTDDAKALHEFSGGAAHRVALYKGYVDGATGEEIRVAPADEIAYKLSLSDNPDDPFKVEEIKVNDNTIVETHGNEPGFEGDKKEDYEYGHKNTPQPANPETSNQVIFGKELPPEQIPIPPENPEATEGIANQELSSVLREQGFTGNPNDRNAVEEFFNKRNETPADTQTIDEQVAEIKAKIADRMDPATHSSAESKPGKIDIHPGENHHEPTSEIAGNPFHLGKEALKQANEIYTNNTIKFFPDDRIWDSINQEKARTILDNGKYISYDTGSMGPAYSYLRQLIEATGLKPHRGFFGIWGGENVEHFVARASQYAVSKGGNMLSEIKNVEK